MEPCKVQKVALNSMVGTYYSLRAAEEILPPKGVENDPNVHLQLPFQPLASG